nr:MAG TPA: hypothetical protein [Microviridae sp.]
MLFCKLLIIICLQVLPEDLYLPASFVVAMQTSYLRMQFRFGCPLTDMSQKRAPQACPTSF